MLKLLTIRCAYEYVLRISAGTVFTHSAGTVQTKDAGPNYVARVLSSQLHYVQHVENSPALTRPALYHPSYPDLLRMYLPMSKTVTLPTVINALLIRITALTLHCLLPIYQHEPQGIQSVGGQNSRIYTGRTVISNQWQYPDFSSLCLKTPEAVVVYR